MSRPKGPAAKLLDACVNGNVDIVRSLVVPGGVAVDVRLPNTKDSTPLIVASKFRRLPVIQALLELKASISAMSSDGAPPLRVAVKGPPDEADAARLLLDAGANPNVRDSTALTPLLAACKDGNVNIVQYLLSVDAVEKAATGPYGETAFTLAVTSENAPLIALFEQPQVRL